MEWLYINNEDNSSRYVLGTPGSNPLFCFGINPSTAEPGNLDSTVKSVERIARFNGHDSWIMLNLYPQRATNPNNMHSCCNNELSAINAEQVAKIVSGYKNPVLWAAWGTLIEKRKYLADCLYEINNALNSQNVKWITIGKRSKAGHPHHPLYLRTDSSIVDFDIEKYLDLL